MRNQRRDDELSYPREYTVTEPTPAPPTPTPTASAAPRKRGWLFYGCLAAAGLALIIVTTAAVTAWWVKRQLNPEPIVPTELTQVEEQVLDEKLETLEGAATRDAGSGDRTSPPDPSAPSGELAGAGDLRPGPGVEPRRKGVTITEKELNALLAKNTPWGDRVALELVDDTIRARTNIDVPDDWPMLGGKTIRLRLSLEATLEDQRMALRVSDVSLSGFPLPNAWLGGIKGVDLIDQYADSRPLRTFVAGIEEFYIADGALTLIPAD